MRYVNAKKLESRKLQHGDIVIEVSGGSPTQPTGRSIYITQKILDRMLISCEPASFCRLFRPANENIGLLLAMHLQKIYADGKMWSYQNQSTGISNFQTTIFLENELIIIPESTILLEFSKKIFLMLDAIHDTGNRILKEIRDFILPKLLSGEIILDEIKKENEIEK